MYGHKSSPRVFRNVLSLSRLSSFKLWYNLYMPAKDILHDTVRDALIKDGWTITHDPFTITFGRRKVFADLGAEKLIAAEKESRRIVVEVKSFSGQSNIDSLEKAIGQYLLYRSWLSRTESERILFIALDSEAYEDLFIDISGRVLLEDYEINIIIVNEESAEIVQWILN